MGTHFICTKGLACWIWSLLTVGVCRTLFLSLVQEERRVIMIECFHKEGMEGLEEWGGEWFFFTGSYFPPLLHSFPRRAWQHHSRTQVPVWHVPSYRLPSLSVSSCRSPAQEASELGSPAVCPIAAVVEPMAGATCGCVAPGSLSLVSGTFLGIKIFQVLSNLRSGPVCQWRIAVGSASEVPGLVKQTTDFLERLTKFN